MFRPNSSACLALSVGSFLAATAPAMAHVRLVAPNGGEFLEVGSTVTITWTVRIQHSLQNWDLWYSATGPNGPWIPIAMNVAPGSPVAGSVHEYQWVVPANMTSQGRIRVRMNNAGTNYEDVSDRNFSIIAATCYADCDQTTGPGTLDIFDFLCFQNAFVNREPYACDCDTTTGQGICDIFDFLCFQNAFVAGCP
jgi:hypothetical protein